VRRPDAARGQKVVELGEQHRLVAFQIGEQLLEQFQAIRNA
jgi:hypothetical protein